MRNLSFETSGGFGRHGSTTPSSLREITFTLQFTSEATRMSNATGNARRTTPEAYVRVQATPIARANNNKPA